MSLYFHDIRLAFLAFPLAAGVFAIPYMIWCYRKYGSVFSFRLVLAYSLILYLLCVYFLVLLPLPSREAVSHMHGPIMQLHPLAFVQDIIDDYPKQRLLHNKALWQFLFNMAMTLPFGFYLRYYFRLSLPESILASFLLSLSFELLQLSALFGYYPRPYRLFDVDDLLANTLGGLSGWLAAGLLLPFLPKWDAIVNKSYTRSQTVSLSRRLCALLADGFLTGILCVLLLDRWMSVICLYYLLSMVLFKGRTPGMALVKIQVVSLNGKNTLIRRILRYIYCFGILLWIPLLLFHTPLTTFWILYLCAEMGWGLLVPFFWFRRRRLFYARWSGTYVVSTFRPGLVNK